MYSVRIDAVAPYSGRMSAKPACERLLARRVVVDDDVGHDVGRQLVVAGARLGVDQREVAIVLPAQVPDAAQPQMEHAHHLGVLGAPDDAAVADGGRDAVAALEDLRQRRRRGQRVGVGVVVGEDQPAPPRARRDVGVEALERGQSGRRRGGRRAGGHRSGCYDSRAVPAPSLRRRGCGIAPPIDIDDPRALPHRAALHQPVRSDAGARVLRGLPAAAPQPERLEIGDDEDASAILLAGRARRHRRRQDLLRDPLPATGACCSTARAWSGTAASSLATAGDPVDHAPPAAAAVAHRRRRRSRRWRSATPSAASAASWSATTTAGRPTCPGASRSRSACRPPTSPICAISSASTSRPRCRATSWCRCTRRSSTRPRSRWPSGASALRLLAPRAAPRHHGARRPRPARGRALRGRVPARQGRPLPRPVHPGAGDEPRGAGDRRAGVGSPAAAARRVAGARARAGSALGAMTGAPSAAPALDRRAPIRAAAPASRPTSRPSPRTAATA